MVDGVKSKMVLAFESVKLCDDILGCLRIFSGLPKEIGYGSLSEVCIPNLLNFSIAVAFVFEFFVILGIENSVIFDRMVHGWVS
jgi:hypothetical protein